MDTYKLLRNSLWAHLVSACTCGNFLSCQSTTFNSAPSLFYETKKMGLCTHVPVGASEFKQVLNHRSPHQSVISVLLQTCCECNEGKNTDIVMLSPGLGWQSPVNDDAEIPTFSFCVPGPEKGTPLSPLVVVTS